MSRLSCGTVPSCCKFLPREPHTQDSWATLADSRSLMHRTLQKVQDNWTGDLPSPGTLPPFRSSQRLLVGDPWKRSWVGSALCCCSLHCAPSSRGTVPLGRGRRGILRQRDRWSGRRPCLLCTLHADMWICHDRTGVRRVHQLMPQIWERVRRGKGHLNSGHSIG